MGSGNSSETPKKARVPDEDEEVLNLSEDEVLVLCLPFRLFIYVRVCAHPPTQIFGVHSFGPKVVRLFNFIEDIRGSKDNSISWTEVQFHFIWCCLVMSCTNILNPIDKCSLKISSKKSKEWA